MHHAEEAVSLAGGMLGRERHVCAFFTTRDQEYRALLPFVRDGLEQGEKAIHLVDPALRQDHLDRLSAGGIDVGSAQAGGQLDVHTWSETYLCGGGFDRQAMTAQVEKMLREARAQGFPRTRVVTHMEWALQDPAAGASLIEYEARAKDVLRQYDDPVVCTYDRARFAAGTTVDVLRAHPMMILDGVLQETPCFLPPGRLLPKLRGDGVPVLRDRYVAALRAGAYREALEVVVEEGLWQDVPVTSLYLEVLQAAQYEIGRLWQARRLGVAEEHLATEIARAAVARLQLHLPAAASNGREAVVACVEDELHDLGAQMVGDFLRVAGFEVRFLGANVPAESLAALVRERPPDLLALSVTTAARLPALRRTIATIRRLAGRGITIVVGGQALRKPGLGRRLGADLHVADARTLDGVTQRLFAA